MKRQLAPPSASATRRRNHLSPYGSLVSRVLVLTFLAGFFPGVAMIHAPSAQAAFGASNTVPHAFNFQGNLSDPGGTALNGTYRMRFGLLTNGTRVWYGDYASVVVTNGYFAVSLGTATQGGAALDPASGAAAPASFLPLAPSLLSGVDSSTDVEIQLEVWNGGSFDLLTPSFPIVSSLFALKADSIGGYDATQLAKIDSSGNIVSPSGMPVISPTGVWIGPPMASAGGTGVAGSTGAMGLTGANGSSGASGTTGMTGSNGMVGTPGALGTTGASGMNGSTGVSGAIGATGATGVSGLNGASGAVGATGNSGSNGFTGVSGAIGATGVSGSNGATGISGAVGATGVSGLNGFTGVSGAVGATGATGISGLNGFTGVSGAVGAMGATGISGTNGTTGVSGAIGATGASGVNGLTGASGVNGLTGASGVNGLTGASGVNGLTGASGVNGLTGASGVNGLTGASGVNGLTGASGVNGLTGASGVNGLTGASGVNGLTGASGVNGLTGASGVNGLTGYTGASGSPGLTGATGASPWAITGSDTYYTAGNVGVGTSAPVGKFDVSDTQTAGATGINAASAREFVNIAAANTVGSYAATYTINYANMAGGSMLGSIYGTHSNALALGSGAGGVANLYGVYSKFGNTSSSGSLTNAYGLYAQPMHTGGSIGSSYALYLAAPQTGGTVTNEYGVYQASTGATNFFAGNVGIGTVGPAVSLDLSARTDAIGVPAGTSGQRPGVPANGMIRYNSSLAKLESYVSGSWQSLTTGASATGSSGLTGVSGVSGATGVSGAVGATGISGSNGVTGVSGANGATGATGVSGTNGFTGVSGAIGATGATGTSGVSGLTGRTGSSGITGATGASPWGISGTATYYNAGLVGIGTPNFNTYALTVAGNTVLGDPAGTTYNATPALSVVGPITSTASPINMNVYDTTAMTTGVGGGIGLMGNDGTTDRTFALVHGGKENATSGNYAGYLGLYTRPNGGVLAERMRIDSNGYVGIGTTGPAEKLAVVGGNLSSDLGLILYRSGTGSYAGRMAQVGGDGFLELNTSLNVTNVALRPNGVSYLTGGNVGIGTATPQAALDVAATGPSGSAIIVPRDTTANRPSAPVNGMLRYNTSLGAMEAYQSGAWTTLSASNAATVTAASGFVSSVTPAMGLNFPSATTLTLTTPGGTALSAGQGANTVLQSGATNTSVAIKALGSQTADLLQVQSSAGTPVFKIDASGNVTLAQATAATSGANSSSGSLSVSGNYWNGSASAVDSWTLQDVLGTGANPSSTLTFGHSGSSGTSSVAFMGGYVGIGTASPSNALDVSGNIALRDATNGWSNTIIPNQNVNGLARTLRFDNSSGATTEGFQFYNSNAGKSLVMIQQNGYVGIGTAAPAKNLDIVVSQNASTFARVANVNGGNAAYAGIQLDNEFNSSFLKIGSANIGGGIYTNRLALDTASLGLNLMATDPAGTMQLYTGGAATTNERIRITSGGNVGIGTTGPSRRLSVVSAAPGSGVMNIQNTSNSGYDSFDVFDDGSFLKFSFGYGNTAAAAWPGSAYIDVQSTTPFAIAQNTVKKLEIDSSGNLIMNRTAGYVGIGGTPGTNLDVMGSDADVTMRVTNQSSTAKRKPSISIVNYAASFGGFPVASFSNYRGTGSSPAPLLSGDQLGEFSFFGAKDSSYGVSQGAKFVAYATENYGATNTGTALAFFTTPNGSTTIAQRLTIDQNGYVGIGKSPNFKLDVNGTINTSGDLGIKDQSILGVSGTNVILGDVGSNGLTVGILANGSERVRVDASGKVGIGTQLPAVSLDVGSRTDAIAVPAGTGGQRPASPANGMIRYNTSTSSTEAYENGAWTNMIRGYIGGATMVGATGCNWTIGTSWTAPGAKAACNAATVDGAATSPGKYPAITFASLPPGMYRIRMRINLQSGTNSCIFRITDGTGYAGLSHVGGNIADGIEGIFTYSTSQSNVTFSLQGKASTTSDCYVYGDDATSGLTPITDFVYRFYAEKIQ